MVYFVIRIKWKDSHIYPEPKDFDIVDYEASFMPYAHHMLIWMSLNTILVIATVCKLLYMLQVFEMFGLLMSLLIQVSYDIKHFLLIFIFSVVMFSWLFQVSGIEIDTGDYENVNT